MLQEHKHHRLSKRKFLPGLLILLIITLVSFVLITSTVAAQPSADGTDPIFGVDTKGLPDWLVVPVTHNQLFSEYDLSTLAGRLIAWGDVDASSCPGGPFLQNGAANECGTKLAHSRVIEWQNQFNKAIMAASQETGVPAILLKNIFIWESQFWPTTVFVNVKEYGLGHITEAGADATLRWNNTFYQQLCRQNFSQEACKRSYADQELSIRQGLMGLVIQKTTVDCAACAYGLDLEKTHDSIPIFANTLLSNANLVNMTITSITGKPARESVSFQDLWKFSLTSYNAGPGCFVTAFSRTYHNYSKLNWDNFSSQLDPGCSGSIKYVAFISNNDYYHPEDSPDLQPTSTPTDAVTATMPVQTPTPFGTNPPIEASPTPTGTLPTPTDELPTPTGTLPTPTKFPTKPSETLPTEETPTPTPFGPWATLTETPTPIGTLITPVATITVTPPPTTDEQLKSPHIPDELLVKIDPLQRNQVMDTLRRLGVNILKSGGNLDSMDTLLVQVASDNLAKVLTGIKNSPGVVFGEPNYLASIASLPNDPEISTQPNLWNIQVPQTWDALPSMQEVLVAVLDTGVMTDHPDLANSIWQNAGELGLDVNGKDKQSNGVDDDGNGYVDDWQGWNTISNTNNISDDNGHGTHLAGIIAAGVNNSIGIAGVAPNARILPIKVLDGSGYGTYTQVAEGIIYATNMGARVLNLGFGGLGSSQVLQEAVNYAISHGVLVIAASGNGGMNSTYYPASYPGVISVGAVDDGLNLAPFSSTNEQVSLVAPGVGINSTWLDGNYRAVSGTSMASAHVSGVAALLGGQPGFFTVDALRSALLGKAFDLGAPGADPFFGFGIVHAYDSLGYAGPILPTPTPWLVPTSTPGGPDGLHIQASQELWGRTQTSTYPIINPSNSIDSAFNDLVASSSGPFGGAASRNWSITSIDDTTFANVALVYLEIRFYITGWVDDYLYIQIYDSSSLACGSTWCTIMTLRPNPTGSSQMVPPSTLTTLNFNVTAALSNVTRVNNARVRITGSSIVGAGADSLTFYLDEVKLLVMDVLPPTPTPTSTPIFISTATLLATRQMTATPWANEPHNNFFAGTDQCANCHRGHSADSVNLRAKTGEEEVCFTCHTAGGSGLNVKSPFISLLNTSTAYFSHQVFNTVNIHLPEENLSTYFGGVNRHIECEDCHDPHSTARTDTSQVLVAPSIQQEMYNSTGVDPIWVSLGSPSGFVWMDLAEREYQVCLKCHSSFTSLPEYIPDGYGWTDFSPIVGYIPNGLAKLTSVNTSQVLDSRDMAKEFNPYQVSFHPLASLGRNQNIPVGSFVSGWSQSSMVYCTDCHQNPDFTLSGKGPHGSSNLHLLAGNADYITRASNNQSDPIHETGEICFKCHQYDTFVTGGNSPSTTHFRNNTNNLHATHSFAACYTCHDSHGSEQDHLLNFDTSVVSVYSGYTSQSAWNYNSITGTGTCYLSCHTADHGTGKTYIP